MKKFIIALMIVSLAVCSAFAIDGLKVGGELGYTRFDVDIKQDSAKLSIGANAFTFSGVVEYQVAQNIDVVAKIGLNAYGKPTTKVTYGGETQKETADDAVPAHFTAYVGGKYTFKVDDRFSTYTGLGFDMMVGKLDKDSAKAGVFFGVKGEAAGVYTIQENLAVTAGVGFTWIFADTSEELEKVRQMTPNASFFLYKLGATVGVTYSF